MPKALSNAARMMIAVRRCRQKLTNWSIIEQYSALDHYLFARRDPGTDGDRGAFLELRIDDAPLEGPGRGGDEYTGAIVIHQQCRTRQHHHRSLRSLEG